MGHVGNPYAPDPNTGRLEIVVERIPQWLVELLAHRVSKCSTPGSNRTQYLWKAIRVGTNDCDISRLSVGVVSRRVLFDRKMQVYI